MDFDKLSREELIEILKMNAKNWLAHDGIWFLIIEEKFGLDMAIELDQLAWKRFAEVEASRIKRVFKIPDNGGLEALEKALRCRMYSQLNEKEIERPSSDTLIFSMKTCRVQAARERDNRPKFLCKSVGIVEFSTFASTIDKRIKTQCISCPPDPKTEYSVCSWEFSFDVRDR